MLTRQRESHALELHVVDFLLGTRRGVAEIERLQASGIRYDSFYEFHEMASDAWQRLWKEHGTALRREARRRGIVLQPVPSGDGPPAA